MSITKAEFQEGVDRMIEDAGPNGDLVFFANAYKRNADASREHDPVMASIWQRMADVAFELIGHIQRIAEGKAAS